MSYRQWLTVFSVLLPASSSGRAQEPATLNPSLSPQERARDLVSRMALDEKATQLEDYATAIRGPEFPTTRLGQSRKRSSL
jgi:hypothetical protein